MNWIWTEDIIMRYYGFFPLVIGGLPTEGDGKLLLLEIGLIYDMITLCSSTESRIGERRLLFELDFGRRRILY